MNIKELAIDFETNYMLRRLKPTTIEGYLRNINMHILPSLATLQINELEFSILDKLVKELRRKGLSNTSIVYVLATLSKMYSYAVKRKYARYNPLLSYDYPRKNAYQYVTLTAEQVEQLLEACKESDVMPAMLLACHYGLRRGEVCAVFEKDIVGNVLHVRRTLTRINGENIITTPKNNKERLIKLLNADVELLSEYSKKRKRNVDGILLRNVDGEAVPPGMLNKKLRKYLRELKLPMVRFHDLRHTYATLMMQYGVNPKIVSTVLGHASVDITLDLYSHCSVDMQDVCLEIFKSKKP